MYQYSNEPPWKIAIFESVRVEHGAVIYPGCNIGEHSVIGANAVLRPNTTIGHHSIFGTLSCSEGDNYIGNYTTIHAQCHITKGVTIGDNCFIAPFFIATNTPDISEGRHGTEYVVYKPLPTVIQDYVRIGANVRMTPGNVIGHHALIDQDTFITKDVPPYAHVRGGKDKCGFVIDFDA
jgi:UDP-2-acetamido-3-amino-2,3-dideoxy-glucuronate N-acetyltransferase